MTADKYRLVVSGMMGSPYIAKISKTNPHLMLDDRRKVPESEFIDAILQWGRAKLNEGDNFVDITLDGKIIATINFKPEEK